MLDEDSGEGMGMKPDPVRDYVITNHASFEMKRRGISPKQVQKVLKNPGQRLTIRRGRDVLQSQVSEGGRRFLIRVFVDVDRSPAEVVTAYRTSKIDKYWRELR
jgi:hypothetical protein